jgi:hypothetical protein
MKSLANTESEGAQLNRQCSGSQTLSCVYADDKQPSLVYQCINQTFKRFIE